MFFIQNKGDRIEILYDVNNPNKVMSKASTGIISCPWELLYSCLRFAFFSELLPLLPNDKTPKRKRWNKIRRELKKQPPLAPKKSDNGAAALLFGL